METRQKTSLRRNHVTLVQDLEPRGDVLNSLYGDGVLTENDCEQIREAPTRRQRCQLLLQLIPTRGPGAYGSFHKALQSSRYEFLADLLDEYHEHDTDISGDRPQRHRRPLKHGTTLYGRNGYTTCDKCEVFLKSLFSHEDCKNSELVRFACPILDNVEPTDVVDQLFQDDILDSDDIDLVKSGLSRRKRCETLLQILIKSTSKSTLIGLAKALLKKYAYIADIIATCDKNLPPATGADEATSAKVVDSNDVNCECVYVIPDQEADTKVKTVDDSIVAVTNESCIDKQGVSANVTDGGHASGTCNSMTRLKEQLEAECPGASMTCVHNTKGNHGKIKQLTLDSNQEITMCKDLVVIPSESSHKSRRLTVAFNYLSTLINQGEFDKYEVISSCLSRRSPHNYDMRCIIGYLNASRDLFRTDFDSAKMNINSTMQIVPKTSNPRYFILELFTAKTRMYITQKKLEKLQTTLDEAMMILETDPGGCTGRAAGWLYINDARNRTAQMSCLNLSKPNALKLYESLFNRAKTSFQRSMTNFKMDGGKDGPFGFGYALCRLVILLLRCGDNGMTMGMLTPPEDDVYSAEQYLQHLEDSDVPIPKIMDVHFLLAKCDYQFRRKKFVRSLQHAQAAYDLATELNMLEFTEHAHNRVKFLRSVAPLGDSNCCHDMSEEEIQEIIFGQSTDTCDTSQSD